MSATTTPLKADALTPSKYQEPSPSHSMVMDCMCPTCMYYRAAMMYHHECQSPMADQFSMYSPQVIQMQLAQMQMMQAMAMSPNAYGNQDIEQPVFDSESVSPMARNIVAQFKNCIGTIAATACTPGGRSLLQSVIRLQHTDKIQQIFSEVVASCEAVVLDQHGCHVVRSLIEVLDAEQLEEFVAGLDETLILNMSTMSQYTRRILQSLFERQSADLTRIVSIVAGNARYLAATQQGCISMMRVFEKCTDAHRQQLLANVLPMFTELACDPFGNYVVQCVLENIDRTMAAQVVVENFSGKFLRLACNKFASNVMEKIIRLASPSLRRMMLDELIFNPAALQQLVNDGFGNFVVQTLIETSATPNEHKKICDRLKPVVASSPYGHKIETKMRAKRNTHLAQRNTNTPMSVPRAALQMSA